VREPGIFSTSNLWSRLAKQEQIEDEELGKERFDHVWSVARAVTTRAPSSRSSCSVLTMSTRPTFSISGVLLLGLIFHLVFINSVFDCYFTSHVVHGMRHFKTQTGEAKRLVLIVGGLWMITRKLPDPHTLRKQAMV
jgi:hypothetical protein